MQTLPLTLRYAFEHFDIGKTTTVTHLDPEIDATLAFWHFDIEKTTTVTHLGLKKGATLAFWQLDIAKPCNCHRFQERKPPECERGDDSRGTLPKV